MSRFEEEKQRRVSRILTIDEIINPGRNIATSHNTGTPEVTHVHVVNPSATHFVRLNQSQVIYSPGIQPITIPGDHVDTQQQQQSQFHHHGSKKSVSFAGSTSSNITSTTAPSVSVYREQYWNWTCTCKDLSRRERGLMYALCILACVILGLVAFISVFARDHRLETTLNDSWLPWTF